MEKEKTYITTLGDLCNSCGYFDAGSPVNSGYGCKHPYCSDGDFLNNKGEGVEYPMYRVAESLSTRNVKCNRRLAKKMIKRTQRMSWEDKLKHLKNIGIKYHGKCFSSSCPIAWKVDFDSITAYENHDEYDHIESEEEMPWGFGDDLMGVDEELAKKIKLI